MAWRFNESDLNGSMMRDLEVVKIEREVTIHWNDAERCAKLAAEQMPVPQSHFVAAKQLRKLQSIQMSQIAIGGD
jgi:hypothetical protein